MAKPTLTEALLSRREQVHSLRVNRRSTRNLSASQRRALAAKEPRGPALLYLRAMAALLEAIRGDVDTILVPVIQEDLGRRGSTLHTGGLDVQVRGDARPKNFNVPKPPSFYTQAFENLEVALTERTKPAAVAAAVAPVAEAIFKHNRREMSRVLQLDLRNQGGLSAFISDFTQANVRLIKGLTTETLQQMEAVVAEGTSGQLRVEDLAERISSALGVSGSRAELIARDQTLKSNAQLTRTTQEQVGVTEYIWTTSRDERVRGRPGGKWANSHADHWALDGTVQKWAQPPITNPRTGAANHPGEDIQCRCVAVPVVDRLLG